jgi:hypothetical protein
MKISEVVQKYVQIRDRRAERKALYQQADAADEKLQSQIEAKLLQVFNDTGMTSVRTECGTAYVTTRTAATIADKEAFMNYVKEHGEWPLLEVRASKAAVEEFVAANDDLPPGINWRSESVVNIRR